MISTKQNMSQGLQSCLNPILKPSKQEQSENHCLEIGKPRESNKYRWNSIEVLAKTSYNFNQIDDNSKQVYVHPLLKHSSSSMSTRSLEMCTESLMSETGSNTFLSTDEFSYLASEEKNSSTTKQPKSHLFSKKVKHSSNIFPPPITSMTGSNGIQMEAHREEGRLVIKAFSLSSCRHSFEVERKNGRLLLSLLKNDDHDNEVEEERENDFNGSSRGKKVGCKIGEWVNSRCIGDGRLPSLQFCVAIS